MPSARFPRRKKSVILMRKKDQEKAEQAKDEWLDDQMYDDPRRSQRFDQLSPLINEEE